VKSSGLLSAKVLAEAFGQPLNQKDATVAQRVCICFWKGVTISSEDLPAITLQTLPEVLVLAQRFGFRDAEDECYWLLRSLIEADRIPPEWTNDQPSRTKLHNGTLRQQGISVNLSQLRIPTQAPIAPSKEGYTLCQIHRTREEMGDIVKLVYDHNQECAYWAICGREELWMRIYEGSPVPLDEMPIVNARYRGVIVSNFWGTSFTLYDAGGNEACAQAKIACEPRTFKLLCQFEANVSGDGPRKLCATLPGRPTMSNNPPKWDAKLHSYSLPFFGRVKMSSAKNFQIVQPPDMENILLMFGKVKTDVFALDFRHPFGILEAFTVALASMAKKRSVS